MGFQIERVFGGWAGQAVTADDAAELLRLHASLEEQRVRIERRKRELDEELAEAEERLQALASSVAHRVAHGAARPPEVELEYERDGRRLTRRLRVGRTRVAEITEESRAI